jgi:hypothetical protein
MFIILVLLSTKLRCSLISLIFIKILLFKILSLKFIFKYLPLTRRHPLVQTVYFCLLCLYCSGLLTPREQG